MNNISAKDLLEMYLQNHSYVIELKTILNIHSKELDKINQYISNFDQRLDNLEKEISSLSKAMKLLSKLFFVFISSALFILIVNLTIALIKR